MKVLDENYVNEHLDLNVCIDLMKKALVAIEQKECTQYIRTALPLPDHNILGLMPSYFNDGYFGVKVLSVFPNNSIDGYPSHQGQVLLFENKHGCLEAIVDAMSITKIRTGCVSALATDILANKDASILALLGCGKQAESHLEAIMKIRDIQKVCIWDQYIDVANRLKAQYPSIDIEVYDNAKDCVKDADIICTLTPSKEVILKGEWVKEGCHINAVGSCAPVAREIDSELVKKSLFYGDHHDSVMKEAGDFLIPLKEGVISEDHYLGDLAQVILGKIEGRKSSSDITVFEALGLASEDIIVAMYLNEE